MESTLAISLSKLQQEVGFYLGYGRGLDGGGVEWTDKKQRVIDSMIESGLRQFYYPKPADMAGGYYDWTFLRPTAQVTTESGTRYCTLPDDFGAIDDAHVRVISSETSYCPVRRMLDSQVNALYAARPTETGSPQCVASTPVDQTTYLKGQRYRLIVFPEPDDAYTLEFAYSLLPDALRWDRPWPYGGAQHAETIQAACIAAAELYLNDMPGPRALYFHERLIASIGQDRKMRPPLIGHNGDPGGSGMWSRQDRYADATITYNGVEY